MNPNLAVSCSRETMHEYSRLCLAEDPPEECYSQKYYGLRIGMAVWSVTNATVASIGNLFTLFAIPYAKRRQR